MAENQEIDTEDIMRILVATDNHLGYEEKDPIKGDDSFIAFEEILELAVEQDVDFILLGGDLFHDAVPSQNSLHKCMTLLRRYTFGDKPITVEYLGEQELNFHSAVNQTVNYEDPNLNVSIPVYSIHGNHDDPSGFGRLSSLDLLSTTGLVNYFGRWTDLSKVEVNPLLLRKGQTRLALYGLSHIHDARLARLFEDHKVKFNCPDAADDQEWFHLLVLHQNRANRGRKNYLPEEVLPEILHLVIWGHEHDCRIEPEYNHKRQFFVSQPGSSVATSLALGEALPKQVALLEIHQTRFKLEPLPLKTVRPLIFESIDLTDMIDELHLDEGDASNKVRIWAQSKVDSMIARAEEMLSGHPKQPKLPLIRLRLAYTEEPQMFNHIRFGQMFNDRVANPATMILFDKAKKPSVKTEGISFDKEAMSKAFENMEIDVNTRIEELVDRYFETVEEKKGLQLMNSKALSEMLFRMVDRKDNNAADNILKYYKEQAVAHLMDTLPTTDKDIDGQLEVLKGKVTHEDILKMLDERGTDSAITTNNNYNNTNQSTTTTTSSSTSRGGRKAAGTARGKTAPAPAIIEDDSDSDSEMVLPKPAPSKRGRGGARGATRGSPAKRGGSGRGSRTMPQLDITVNTSRSTRQATLLNVIEQKSRSTKAKHQVIELSDSD